MEVHHSLSPASRALRKPLGGTPNILWTRLLNVERSPKPSTKAMVDIGVWVVAIRTAALRRRPLCAGTSAESDIYSCRPELLVRPILGLRWRGLRCSETLR